ncbi:MAG: alpha/beta hydrolase family esterase, partial [Mangrovicoccus sp.]
RPDGQGTVPAIVFLHGWGSQGANTMGNRRLVQAFLDRGYAFLAPDGTPRGSGGGRSWSFHPDWPPVRDERAFLKSVIADAAVRFDVDPERVILSGFSAGGFMVSYAACAEPDLAAAYAPVSGGFWRPHPESCEGPVKLLHSHGWRDKTVPLEGRFLRGGQVAQGDIFHGMEIWREANGCDGMTADDFSTRGEFWLRSWSRCDADSALDFALFPGGHTVPAGWADMAMDWFEAL